MLKIKEHLGEEVWEISIGLIGFLIFVGLQVALVWLVLKIAF